MAQDFGLTLGQDLSPGPDGQEVHGLDQRLLDKIQSGELAPAVREQFECRFQFRFRVAALNAAEDLANRLRNLTGLVWAEDRTKMSRNLFFCHSSLKITLNGESIDRVGQNFAEPHEDHDLERIFDLPVLPVLEQLIQDSLGKSQLFLGLHEIEQR